ncbi:4'-phosphopantetheinyl transferase family protein [Actinacidiphila oryziradicis]|uniref:4'-phosphopantetheinyl transferase superfamily protein n=1 Tax=Actinacidiphila oryziradicis TaxID=2571141 RepID=A0A4U0RXD2_9ACTN|nr:4'-phosphopantetheinyl transferase superfamily protein [Actinacidiphila oryziradicis]TKA00293.1 4'-phosphopantetheinyl transferase superfamily protein [Actinacidiphila oryziradicis]
MFESILPSEVIVEGTTDDASATPLLAEEAAVLSAATIEKRRREFTTVRHCARRALARLGLPPAPIVPGERGAPRWPQGILGSMTHCDGYRAAALARTTDFFSLGIDAEPAGPLPKGVLKAVSSPTERSALAALADRRPDVHWDTLLFSAKESVYKAWFPLTHRFLDFSGAELEFHPGSNSFTARLLIKGPVLPGHGTLSAFTGRWTQRQGLVLTAIAAPAVSGSSTETSLTSRAPSTATPIAHRRP